MSVPILSVSDLEVTYRAGKRRTHAVRGVSFELEKGQTLALVGESGCGKSTTARVIAGLERPSSGTVEVAGYDVAQIAKSRTLRHLVQMVFQHADQALNRTWRVSRIVAEPLRHLYQMAKRSANAPVVEALARVGLDEEYSRRYPRELSGGQAQRVVIARVLVASPELVVLDEPTASLDQTVRSKVLSLLEGLQRDREMSYVFISHDLASVRRVAHHVAVMYLGRVVEWGTRDQVFNSPQHPYTQGLLASEPPLAPGEHWDIKPMRGETPSASTIVPGCSFRARCPIASDHCATVDPPTTTREDGRKLACLNR